MQPDLLNQFPGNNLRMKKNVFEKELYRIPDKEINFYKAKEAYSLDTRRKALYNKFKFFSNLG
jgi:hypothetical protein